MTTTKSEALELADDLDRMYDTLDPSNGWLSVVGHAGDEIRRMHTDILELLTKIDRLTLSSDLEKFLDIAAGEGYVFGGVDAADLYLKYFSYKDNE